MRSKSKSFLYEFTRHARDRQGERGIPTCLVRLAIDRGRPVVGAGRVRFVLRVTDLDAAGFGPGGRGIEVVVCGRRILTVMWNEEAARGAV
jgi:hypothetical protein